jgi:hypothetical protein
MMKEFWEWLGLPNPKLTSYTFWMANQTITKPVGLIKDLDFQIHRISYIATFMVMKNNVLEQLFNVFKPTLVA